MVLPEIHIRLEIDGEVVKDYHLQQPYTHAQRRNVIANLSSHGEGQDCKNVFVVLAPVYVEKTETLGLGSPVRRNPLKPSTPNNRERRQKRLDFVIGRIEFFDGLYSAWKDRQKRRRMVNSSKTMLTLLAGARIELGYRDGTTDMEIADALFNCYRKHLDNLEFQKLRESL